VSNTPDPDMELKAVFLLITALYYLTDAVPVSYITAQWQLCVPLALTFKNVHILPTQCVYMFRMVLTTNRDYVLEEQ
jgi:hypothetical protein